MLSFHTLIIILLILRKVQSPSETVLIAQLPPSEAVVIALIPPSEDVLIGY